MIEITGDLEINQIRALTQSELEEYKSDPEWKLIAMYQDDEGAKFVMGREDDGSEVVDYTEILEQIEVLEQDKVDLAQENERLKGNIGRTADFDAVATLDEVDRLRAEVKALSKDNRILNSSNGGLLREKEDLRKEMIAMRNKVGEYENSLKIAKTKIESQRRDIFLGGECLRQLRDDLGNDEVQVSVDKILKFSSTMLSGGNRIIECPECDHAVECANLALAVCPECHTHIKVPNWQPFEARPIQARAD